MEIIPVKFVL